MKKIITGILLCAIAAAIPSVYAQERVTRKEEASFNYSIAVQPTYLFNGGLRIDVEKQLKNPRHVIQLSAIGYLLPRTNYEYEGWESPLIGLDDWANKLTGAGLALDYKYFPFRNAKIFYISGGISYNYFDVRYDAQYFINYQEDGMTLYEPRWGEIKQVFNKTGVNACLGARNPPNRRFLIEGYIGLGYTYSFYDENKRHFDENQFTIGHRGMSLLVGGRIGWRFGRR